MASGNDKAAVTDHGGSLDRARALFPDAPQPWIDLSTGINPHSYPVFDLPATAFSRLPEPARNRDLAHIAATAYGAPSDRHVVPAPGTQILLPRVASLIKPGRALVLGPTYAEHRRACAVAGHHVQETDDIELLPEANLAVVVNPNNPDGRVVMRKDLLDLAAILDARGGLLVVDEAFMDVGPPEQSLAGDVGRGGIVVLKSFGKFYGLAGVRLGFALAVPELAARLDEQLGPWAVGGPALETGIRALADKDWPERTRNRLAADAARLDGLLARHDIPVTGGTSLFRYAQLSSAGPLFATLGGHGILVRDFAERPQNLRFGLPATEAEWGRLERALCVWRDGHGPILQRA
jgi:cobalamin biosynthetic protein CobC